MLPRVLVIEGDEINEGMMVARLWRLRCRVFVSPGGTDAASIVENEAIDIVLLDTDLPRQGSAKTFAAIRQLGGPAGRVPIVAVSDGPSANTRDTYLAAGYAEHVNRPPSRASLKRLMAKCL